MGVLHSHEKWRAQLAKKVLVEDHSDLLLCHFYHDANRPRNHNSHLALNKFTAVVVLFTIKCT
jgi:hypothetical protein